MSRVLTENVLETTFLETKKERILVIFYSHRTNYLWYKLCEDIQRFIEVPAETNKTTLAKSQEM